MAPALAVAGLLLVSIAGVRHLAGRLAGGRLLAVASGLHATNDACVALLYPLLPLVAAEFGLGYAAVGVTKAVFTGASSALQLPVGLVAKRFGTYRVLVLGNLWLGLGLVAMAVSGGYAALLGLAALAGLGGNAQHPLAADLVSRDAPDGRTGRHLGTLNFTGDLGKLAAPIAASALLPLIGWRGAMTAVGLWAVLMSLAVVRAPVGLSADGQAANGSVATARPGGERGLFWLLLAGGLDTATRAVALTFLPFWLPGRGFDLAAVSVVIGVIFAAGAAGKYACGWLADRWGALGVVVFTELVTAAALLGFLAADGWPVFVLAAAFGFALNGTSSPLTATVARLTSPARRAWAYGAYFSVTLVGSALAPAAAGLLADSHGLPTVLAGSAVMTALVIPAIAPIRRAVAAAGTA